jgi:hypothetical protein
MDVVEQRIREVVATLLSSGAKALERTASELERAASGLRPEHDRVDAERVWSERADDIGPAIGSRRVQQIAEGTVADVRTQLTGLSAEELRELREVEVAGRNRTTLVAVIDRMLEIAE